MPHGPEGTPGAFAWDDMVEASIAGKVTKGALGVINVRDFDVLPTNTAAVNATNVTSARAALGATSGTLHFPPGDYPMDPLDFSMFANVTLTGVASMVGGVYSSGSGDAASRLLFPSVTTGYGIKVDGSYGFTMRDLAAVATNSAFSGRLLDMRLVSGSINTGLVTLERCFIAGYTTNRYGIGVDLDQTVSTRISRCTIVGFQHGVQGLATVGSFSNGATIEESYFINNWSSHIHNPGDAWVLKGNTYQGLWDGAKAGAVLQDAGFTSRGITIVGGWLGDIATGHTSTQFNFLGTVYGLDAHGIYIGGNTGVTGFYFAGGSGIHIHGNTFDWPDTAVTAAVGVTGVVGPNAYVHMTGVNVTAPTMDVSDIALPLCRLTTTTAQNTSATPATFTAVAFNVETYDTANLHNNATNNSRVTVAVAGYYRITGKVRFGFIAGVNIYVSGVAVPEAETWAAMPAGAWCDPTVTATVFLTAGQYVELFFASTSANAALYPLLCFFEVAFVSP